MRPIVGASFFSAAASLPLHLMPFLVAAIAADGRMPLAQAGWIASAFAAGQLACTLALPMLGARSLSASVAALAAGVAALLPWLAGEAPVHALPGPWFVVGLACGALQFLGATAAAAAVDRARAFGWRLCFVLVASAAATLLFAQDNGAGGYFRAVCQIGVAVGVLGALGTMLYRPPATAGGRAADVLGAGGHWPALSLVFIVFAAQPGFWAYAVEEGQRRGLEMAGMAYAVAACKVVAALGLWVNIHRPHGSAQGMLWPGVLLAAGVLVIVNATGTGVFMAGALLREVGVTLLSVRFQAAVVAKAGPASGPWLAATIFAGAAAGPLAHGWALEAGYPLWFTGFACVAALVPFAWHQLPGRWLASQRAT
jgi:hypothetical protein